MTWHIVHLNDVEPTPWRNGAGTTRELLAWPDSAAWQWRASVAQVSQDGPFSNFAGIQRWFAVLEGDGVCLTVDGCMHMLTKSDQPLAFDGAVQTSCTLLGGITQDFNLMVQSGVAARMLRIKGGLLMNAVTPKIIAVYVHQERATVQIGTEIQELSPHCFAWTHVQVNTNIQVLAADALLIEIDV
jgi:environmental stress-induced protein Ves